MRFSTIEKQLKKMGYSSFDELIKIIDCPVECTRTKHLNNIIAFTRYILIHNKRHAASSAAAKKREVEYLRQKEEQRSQYIARLSDIKESKVNV